MTYNHPEKGSLSVEETIKHLNRCLYPELHEVDALMEKISTGKLTQLALKSFKKKLYAERNIPLGVI
jgi:hypothetical protein